MTSKIEMILLTFAEFYKITPDDSVVELVNRVKKDLLKIINEVNIIEPKKEPPKNKLSQNQIFMAGQINMKMRIRDLFVGDK